MSLLRQAIFNGSRLYSTQSSQSPLAVLRRKTGYPFSKCKDALTRHDNDVALAEKYLKEQAQREGWVKAEKVKGRATRQGLIGVMVKDNKGIMVEVNCETDFVSKNTDFRQLVAEIAETTYNNTKATTAQAPLIQHIDPSTVSTLGLKGANNAGTIADLVAKNIGHFGENITVSRGCLATAVDDDVKLSSYVYNDIVLPESNVVLGTYASFVFLRLINKGGAKDDLIESLGVKVGQHIVGMNPTTVDGVGGDGRKGECLVDQPYLLDSSVSVGDWLKSHDLHVTEFIRYELGEH